MRPDGGPGATLDPETDDRLLGAAGTAPGPALVAVGGLHGNEPAGAEALRRVLVALDEDGLVLQGRFIAVRGNPVALRNGERFVDADLNRHWARDRVRRIVRGDADPTVAEDGDVLALSRIIGSALAEAEGSAYVLDLHTTSGDSAPFATVGDTLRNRALAQAVPVPMVLGLEEHIDGTLLAYYNREGYSTLGLEGGRHDDPGSADRLEAGVWLTLAATGILADPRAADRLAAARALLEGARRGLPRVMEVRHRHVVHPGDGFAMRRGFRSFQYVRAGTVLAEDAGGQITAPESGYLMMPLYQRSGDDGFFITREFSPFWLILSAWLRRIRADRLAPILPGVRRQPHDPETLIIKGRVARWFALEVFHLLGYRKRRQLGRALVVTRRKE